MTQRHSTKSSRPKCVPRWIRNPVTRIADLFTLGVAVTTADGKTKKYADFHQVESEWHDHHHQGAIQSSGLKSLLHKDDVAIPFFLDEIETLDPANRQAVIQTAKKLGFIAITAAPSAVGEVDTCYFLEPDKRGRVVLTDAQRLGYETKDRIPRDMREGVHTSASQHLPPLAPRRGCCLAPSAGNPRCSRSQAFAR